MEPGHKHPSRIIRTAQVCDEWCRSCRIYDRVLPASFLGGVLLFLVFFLTLAAPVSFPVPTYVHIEEGQTLMEVGQTLKEKNIIRWPVLFAGFARLRSGSDTVVAGEYFFDRPLTVLGIAGRLVRGEYEITPIRVVFFEGTSARQMAEILEEYIPDFKTEKFLELALPKEGYLFPDTYFIYPGEKPEVVVGMLEDNFQIHIAQASSSIAASERTIEEILIMASLLEKEAADMQSRRMIAGILWNRIENDMLLQVDAVFPYIIGKNTFNVTREELQVDSPYNTYKHKGLPIGPITNPGLGSIIAAATPIDSDYVFYLSDYDGNFHYSETYTQHLRNKEIYIDGRGR